MGEVLVVQSKIKDYIKKKGCNTSGDLADQLSKTVQKQLDRAVERAKSNGRKTVRAHDFCIG